ncbi:MAG: glycosyltransferase family 25 protein, partial [Dehalococcoidia bacterium]
MDIQSTIKNYFESNAVRKLQVGCQNNLLEGWLNTDVTPLKSEIMFLDARQQLPFEDNVFHYVFAEHMIEHINYQEGCFFLKECFRVLNPGGKIRLAAPDLNCIVNLYNCHTDELGSRYLKFAGEAFSPAVKSNYDTFAINQWFRGWDHKFIYDFKTLESCLINAGFSNIVRCNVGESNDPNLCDIERHGYVVSPEFNDLETMVLEAQKINCNYIPNELWNTKAIKKLHEYFDRTYLINLDSRKDRLEESLIECNKYGIKFERFRACDGQQEMGDITPAEASGMLPRHWNKGSAGLCVSTITILKQCQKDKLDTVLIMEDDVHFNPKIYDILDDAMKQVPEQWESIFFGLNDFESISVSKNVNLIKSGYAAHCFALKKDVFQFIIESLSAMNNPSDVVYDKYLFPRNRSYVIKPHLAWQRFSQSNITGRYAYAKHLIPDEYKGSINTENIDEFKISDLVHIIADGEMQVSDLERQVYQLKGSLVASN